MRIHTKICPVGVVGMTLRLELLIYTDFVKTYIISKLCLTTNKTHILGKSYETAFRVCIRIVLEYKYQCMLA